MTPMLFPDFLLERAKQMGYKNIQALHIAMKHGRGTLYPIMHGKSPGSVSGNELCDLLDLNLKELLLGARTGIIFIEKACKNIPYSGVVAIRYQYGEDFPELPTPKLRAVKFMQAALSGHKRQITEELLDALYLIFEASPFPIGVKTLRSLATDFYTLGIVKPQPRRKRL